MENVRARLAALQDFLKSWTAGETAFILEGGEEFFTSEDPYTYLMKHGAFAPDGRRIVRYPHPVEGVDPLSMSLYELLDEAVKRGRLELPELESDDIGG